MARSSLTYVALGAGSLALLAALHCGSSSAESVFGDRVDPCSTVFKNQCGLACTTDLTCPSGLYCGVGEKCTAECAPASICANGVLCSSRGRCSPEEGPSFDGGAMLPPVDATVSDTICADINVSLTKVLPKVVFLLDQSSSMFYNKFPDGTSNGCNPDCRWTVLKDVLIGPAGMPGGVIKQLEAEAELGIEMYSATDPNPNDGDNSFLDAGMDGGVDNVCPRFNGKTFDGLTLKVNNFSAIDALLRPTTVDDDTPTGPAVRAVVGIADDGGVNDTKGFAAIPATVPKVLVLVTDGEPALCGDNSPSDAGRASVVSAVQQTYNQKIRTFVITLGASAQSQHFQEVANAGQGLDPATGDAGVINPSTPQQLVTALQQIVLDARTCTFKLNGQVKVGSESLGIVTLNGSNVPFDAPGAPEQGWRLKDPSTLELVGSSCTALKTTPNATLTARFPCGTVDPIPK